MILKSDELEGAVQVLLNEGFVKDERHMTADPRIHDAYYHPQHVAIVIFRPLDDGSGFNVEGERALLEQLLNPPTSQGVADNPAQESS